MKKARPCVLVFFINPAEKWIYLARKYAKSPVGPNTWNGYGGGINDGETEKSAVVRETREEAGGGLTFDEVDLIPRGEVTFYHFDHQPICAVRLFVCFKFNGEPVATKEMLDPRRVPFLQISSLKMMPGDKLFIPLLLMGKSITNGYIIFNKKMSGVEDYSLPTC